MRANLPTRFAKRHKAPKRIIRFGKPDGGAEIIRSIRESGRGHLPEGTNKESAQRLVRPFSQLLIPPSEKKLLWVSSDYWAFSSTMLASSRSA